MASTGDVRNQMKIVEKERISANTNLWTSSKQNSSSRESPWIEPSHGAHQQTTLVVDGGFEHGLQHPYAQYLGRLSSLHE